MFFKLWQRQNGAKMLVIRWILGDAATQSVQRRNKPLGHVFRCVGHVFSAGERCEKSGGMLGKNHVHFVPRVVVKPRVAVQSKLKEMGELVDKAFFWPNGSCRRLLQFGQLNGMHGLG